MATHTEVMLLHVKALEFEIRSLYDNRALSYEGKRECLHLLAEVKLQLLIDPLTAKREATSHEQ